MKKYSKTGSIGMICAVRDKNSEDPEIRSEAKRSLGILKQKDPEKFNDYKLKLEGADKLKSSISKMSRDGQRVVVDKVQYLREHPEIDAEELRRKARERLLKGKFGIGLLLDIPFWIKQDEMLKSFDCLALTDLITGRGEIVPRSTLLRKCIKITKDDRRVDETFLRKDVLYQFESCCKFKTIELRTQRLYEPIRTMIREEATLDELLQTTCEGDISVGKLINLINSKNIRELSDEEMRQLEQKNKPKKSKNAKKREKRRKEKEALEKDQKTN